MENATSRNMDAKETIQDIIQEMRDLSNCGGLCFVGADGMAEYADRIEVAVRNDQNAQMAEILAGDPMTAMGIRHMLEHERECRERRGNAAAMREALLEIVDVVYDVDYDKPIQASVLDSIVKIVRAALAKPARNCDKFDDDDDAFAAWHDSLADGDVVSVRNGFKWLFAPAKEGGQE